MIFQHTIQQVLDGTKSQTRRIMKPGDYAWTDASTEPATIRDVWSEKRHMKYCVGQTLAVQPGRTAKGIARIRITAIRCEDVRNISDEDVRAEGFDSPLHFLATWNVMHNRPFQFCKEENHHDWTCWYKRSWSHCPAWMIQEWLAGEAVERYQAWCLSFELVRPAQPENWLTSDYPYDREW